MAWNKKGACIWHAFTALDVSGSGTVDKSRLKVLTHNIANSLGLVKVEERLAEHTESQNVSFEDYVKFFSGELTENFGQSSEKLSTIMTMDMVDEVSWLVCCKYYTKREQPILDDDSIFKLWRIFNMLCEVTDDGIVVFPVVMDHEEVSFLLNKFHKIVGLEFDDEKFGKEFANELPLFSLNQLINLIERHHCGGRVDKTAAAGAIGDIYDELVAEVLQKGYLHKRGNMKTKALAAWRERWFSLSTRSLTYYTNRDEKERKGEIPTTTMLGVELVQDRGSTHSRFNLLCRERTYELYAPDQRTRSEWMAVLNTAMKLSKTPLEYPPMKARDKRREAREGRRRRLREEEERRAEQQEELDAVRRAKAEMEERMREDARRRDEEMDEEKRRREEERRLLKEEEERIREELEQSRRQWEQEMMARKLMEERVKEEEEERRREMEKSREHLEEQKRLLMEAEQRRREEAEELRAAMEEAERVRQEQADKSQEMLEAEKQERARVEERLREEAAQLEQERRRLQELEQDQKELEELLKEERQAKEDEEMVRAAQARVLQEELEQKESLLRVKQELEAAMAEEQGRREELERLRARQEEQLRRGQQEMEQLQVIKQQQDEILQEEQTRLRQLEEVKLRHEEQLKEGKLKLDKLTQDKEDMQNDYKDALQKLQEAEKAKEEQKKKVVKKEQEKPYIVPMLRRPIQPEAKPLVTHRGQGAFTELEFKLKARQRSVDQTSPDATEEPPMLPAKTKNSEQQAGEIPEESVQDETLPPELPQKVNKSVIIDSPCQPTTPPVDTSSADTMELKADALEPKADSMEPRVVSMEPEPDSDQKEEHVEKDLEQPTEKDQPTLRDQNDNETLLCSDPS